MKREKPGQYPYARGLYKQMYKKKIWTMRQYAGFTNSEETNKRFIKLLNGGVTGLSIAFDLPTQIGYDSDDPMSTGEVGKVGVPISILDDMQNLFKDIDLDKVSTSMTINATAPILLAFYIVTAEKKGTMLNQISGTIQNDILKEYSARGTYIYPPKASMKLVADVMEFCDNHVPNFNPISVSGYHIREAGSTAEQELAFTFSNAISYVQSAIDRGLDPNNFGTRMSFFFNAHNGFIEEIAKFRAARKIWATIMRNRFSVKNEKALFCRFHTQTGGSTLTSSQLDNNIVRTTIQALSAVLGGTQSLHTNSKDEALALPSEQAAKTALRTQQIIALESGVTKYPDPFGGSYIIEKITQEYFENAIKLIEKIDNMGGAIKAIETGYIENEITKSAYQNQKDIDSNKELVVGLNAHIEKEEEYEQEIHKIDVNKTAAQIANLKAYKLKRNNSKVNETLDELKKAVLGNHNVMPYIINSVRNRCSLGEVANTLRSVFGEY